MLAGHIPLSYGPEVEQLIDLDRFFISLLKKERGGELLGEDSRRAL
jgi:hypothetical protein